MQIVLTTQQIRALPARRWIAALLLAVYSIGHSCLPAGPAALKFGCRCDRILQETSSCCCLKKIAGSSAGACCALPAAKQKSASKKSEAATKPGPASCCKQPSTKSESAKACCATSANDSADEETEQIVITACSCDSPQDAGYLINTDPRVASDSLSVDSPDGLVETCQLSCLIPSGLSLLPALPPPRHHTC